MLRSSLRSTLRLTFTLALLFAGMASPLHAQTGCNDSPEAPTDILWIIGAGGMVYGSALAGKLLRKRNR